MLKKGVPSTPRFMQANIPSPIRFQPRDGNILRLINEFDGILARRHIKNLFWPRASWQAMERRLSILKRNSYIDWPSTEHRHTKPIPEPIIWLGWKGAIWIAGQYGQIIQVPPKENENQMRNLNMQLTKTGFRWLREPRWFQLSHDLAVIDFRLALEKSLQRIQNLALEEWIVESEFRSNTDTVLIKGKDTSGKSRWWRKGVCPDGYFVVLNKLLLKEGKPSRARFLLELDNGTHSNRKFGLEKVLPGIAYIKSPEYKTRFGYNTGRWLVITSGKARMENLMKQTKERAGHETKLFFFTNFEKLQTGNVVTSPIWWQVGQSTPQPLIIEG